KRANAGARGLERKRKNCRPSHYRRRLINADHPAGRCCLLRCGRQSDCGAYQPNGGRMSSRSNFPIRRMGQDGNHYFFGYYNKSNWNSVGNRLLANQVPWRDAYLTPDLLANVGYFVLENEGQFKVIGQTSTWNWQMGCQLQWLGKQDQTRAIYNIRTDDADSHYPYFGAEMVDVQSGERRTLPLPVYVVASNGQWALSVDYRRLYITHETIGYPCDRFKPDLENCPTDDGI